MEQQAIEKNRSPQINIPSLNLMGKEKNQTNKQKKGFDERTPHNPTAASQHLHPPAASAGLSPVPIEGIAGAAAPLVGLGKFTLIGRLPIGKPFMACMAALAASGVEYSMKQKPLLRLVPGSCGSGVGCGAS